MVFFPKAVATLKVVLSDYGAQIQQPKSIAIQPVSCSIQISSYVQANLFDVTFRFEDLPLDPRLIKTALITISIFNERGLDLKVSEKKAIIVGFADSYSINMDSSERTVRFSGRDYTSLMIDSRFDDPRLEDKEGKRRRKIPLGRPLVDILKDILGRLPAVSSLKIDDRTNGAVKNFLRAAGGNFSLTSGKVSTYGKNQFTDIHESYWDLIVNLCETAGLICYVELDRLVLTTPRILYQASNFSSKRPLPLIWGKNIEKLSFKRNLSRKKKFNILLSSLNTRDSTTTKVSIPRDATDAWAKAANIEKGVQKVLSLDSQGAQQKRDAPAYLFRFIDKTREELVSLGQGLYEQFIKQQVSGSLTTREMSITDSQGSEIDLTQLKIGTPVLIEFAQEDIKFAMRKGVDGENISDSQRLSYLLRRGYSLDAAGILVQAASQIAGKIKPSFYLSGMNLSMNSDGFSLDIDFVNFIVLSERTAQGIKSG